MNEIILNSLQLKTFTEQDALDYCQINNINPDNITVLDLFNNKLTDISGLKLFKNAEELYLSNNKLTDISVLKYLNNLKFLGLIGNNITDIFPLKNLINIEELNLGYNEITDISAIQYLDNILRLDIRNLELESDQIQYIKSLNNLKILWCKNGFKDMNIIKLFKSSLYTALN